MPNIDKLLETIEKNAEKYFKETHQQKANAYFDIKVAKRLTQNELKKIYHDNINIIFTDNKNLRAYKLTKDGKLVLI